MKHAGFAIFATVLLTTAALAQSRPVPQPSDVVGTWGAFDKTTGQCTPDAVEVDLASTQLRIGNGGDLLVLEPIGPATCRNNRCTVRTKVAVPKYGIWTWTFRDRDVATIQGKFPLDGSAEGLADFKETLKRGCR
jgi:hypothetical protein